ncbi:MAG: MinD/ParA family protein [Lachnospiraceae bacterium]|nr:MinD/ParA family protein [Lachnospiraceae bacterium]
MDQAEGLRNVIKAREAKMVGDPRIFAITSGKGGVGKSNTAVNLAIAFRKMDKRVIIFDADLGLANVEVMFGTVPRYSLKDFVYGDMELPEIITRGPMDIGFISGGSGMLSLNNLDEDQRQGLVYGLSRLSELCDILLIDTGAGVSDSVLDFVMASPEVLLVTTPEPSAITDAYSLIKAVFGRRDTGVRIPDISVVANKVISDAEGDAVFTKLSSVVDRFLNEKVKYMGCIPQDPLLENAVRSQKIVSIVSPASKSARAYFELANRLLGQEPQPEDTQTGLFRFFASFIK